MLTEPLRNKRMRGHSGFVGQQLCFDAMDSWRLLQSLDHMRKQASLDLLPAKPIVSLGDKQVANHALIALIDKEGVAKHFPPRNRRVPGQELRIHITENHFGRAAVVPAEQV